MALLERRSRYGLYHCVNSGYATWSAVARYSAAIAGVSDGRVRDIRMEDANLVAPRPRFAALSNAKLAAEGVAMPTWQDAIARYVRSRVERT
jgi:dTDP-4-dehydrorhamnose reductase